MFSKPFKPEFFDNSVKISLTPDQERFRTPETLYLYIVDDKSFILKKMGWMIGASILFTVIIISAFALTVRTMFNQKKLSEIKSDFINNMTHELKTPLATISLAIDALTNEKVIHNSEQVRYYSGMIKDENKRMNKQVEKILQAARIERQDIKLNLQKLNAHDIIQKVADNLSLQIQEKNGSLSLALNAPRYMIEADEVHFSNIIFNLLDNAIKYSKDNLHIDVSTDVVNGMLAIKVKDNGIGMNRETASRVFEKFYRAHTGNIHNVKGFGLGLSYVKATVEAHQGKVSVDSTLGKGSSFTVLLPLA
jgi:two-component system phosphate regulon sensor histidine kinase PhoR